MSSTFGDQPGDVVTSSRGDVLNGVVLSLYPTSADAAAGTNLLTSVTTNVLGRWSYTHATLTVVWVRTLDGQVYAVEDPTATAASAVATAGTNADAKIVAEHDTERAHQSSTYARLFHVNVLDYGAVADYNGATGTDNLAAFNAALNAVAIGGRVFTPPGRYYCSDAITISKTVDFDCAIGGINSNGTQLIFAAGKSGIIVTAQPGWRVGPFSLLSKSTAAGADVGFFVQSGFGFLDRVDVQYFGSHGIHFKAGVESGGGNVNTSLIVHPRCVSNRGDGIRVEGSDANAVVMIKPDVTANYGWGINIIMSASAKIISPHADQTYNGSPGAYRDAGVSNDWDWVYSEAGAPFLIDTGSSHGRLTSSLYGAPALTFTAYSLLADWDIRVDGKTLDKFEILGVDSSNKTYRFKVGTIGVNSFDLINQSDGKMLFSVDAAASQVAWWLNVVPADGTRDLGTVNSKWRNAYMAGFLVVGSAVTGSRPSPTANVGAMFYDTTLSKPIWSDGTVWRDAAGTAV